MRLANMVVLFVVFTAACGPRLDVVVESDEINYVVTDASTRMQFVDQDVSTPEMDMLYFRVDGRQYLFTQHTVGMFADLAGSEESILLPLEGVDTEDEWDKIQAYFLEFVRPAYMGGRVLNNSALSIYLASAVRRG